jgi:hypothetical protein
MISEVSSSIVITPPSNSVSPTNPHTTTQDTSTSADTSTSEASQPVTAIPAKNPSTPGEVTVSWQPVSSSSPQPSGYVIEYRDASIPSDNTSIPWKQVKRVDAGHQSASFTLPVGKFVVRVAALFPGESPRIILGVAHITIAAYEAALSATPPVKPSSSFIPLVAICIGLVMVAFFIFMIIAWKRKRRKQASQSNLPPRWQ